MSENILMDFDPNDFIIRLNPVLDDDGNWDGDIAIGVLTTPDNELDDDAFDQMMYLTTMLTAALPLMEDNIAFRKLLAKYADEMEKEDAKADKVKPTTEPLGDNVVKLKF